jgi:hypothetical protein
MAGLRLFYGFNCTSGAPACTKIRIFGSETPIRHSHSTPYCTTAKLSPPPSTGHLSINTYRPMSSHNNERGARGQKQHVSQAATHQSVRRKRNLVLQQLSLAVGTVQRITGVLREIDATLTAPDEDEGGEDHDDDPTEIQGRDSKIPRREGVASATSAPVAASSAFAWATTDASTTTGYPRNRTGDANDTRDIQGSSQGRSVAVKQRLLLEELKRWKDS